jgi:predicted nucleic acid-binding protein
VTRQAVIDSCVSVKWLINEDHSERAIGLLSSDVELVAPDIVLAEAANALGKTVKRGLLTPEQADARLTNLPSFFNRLLPTMDLVPEALTLGMAVDVPVYDCIYVIASRRTGTNLVTADSGLIARLVGTPDHSSVVHIADWK